MYHNGQYGGGVAQSLLHEMMHMYYYNDPDKQKMMSGTASHWMYQRLHNDFNYLHIPIMPDFASAFKYIISPYGCLNFEELHATYRLGLVIQNMPEAVRRKYGLIDPEFHYSIGVGETRYGSWPNGREDYCVGVEDPGRIETMAHWKTWGEAYPYNPEKYAAEGKDLIMPIDTQEPAPSTIDYRYPSPPNTY